jgi:hypothetical protein
MGPKVDPESKLIELFSVLIISISAKKKVSYKMKNALLGGPCMLIAGLALLFPRTPNICS